MLGSASRDDETADADIVTGLHSHPRGKIEGLGHWRGCWYWRGRGRCGGRRRRWEMREPLPVWLGFRQRIVRQIGLIGTVRVHHEDFDEIGRASCRGRVEISVVAV